MYFIIQLARNDSIIIKEGNYLCIMGVVGNQNNAVDLLISNTVITEFKEI